MSVGPAKISRRRLACASKCQVETAWDKQYTPSVLGKDLFEFLLHRYCGEAVKKMQFGNASTRARFIVVGILMSIVLMLPQINLASHNPIASIDAGIERHLLLESEESDYSPHSHENGTLEEANLDHQHGHNSADHTHLSVYISSQSMSIGLRNSIWLSDYERSHLSPAPFQWQRPPKRIHFS